MKRDTRRYLVPKFYSVRLSGALLQKIDALRKVYKVNGLKLSRADAVRTLLKRAELPKIKRLW